jgi:WD repeat-containing protein 23
VISNGKDQAMRLWDLRQMRSQSDITHDASASVRYGKSSHSLLPFANGLPGLRNFDYRGGTYAKPRYEAHPKDCSVMTYRGHHVLKTLIRCNFSPIESTGGQYLYTGGSNGIIYIYALDGRVVQGEYRGL